MEVYIITEGGEKTGFGHLTRCISIYQAFEKKGIAAKLIINGDKTINELIKNKRYKLFNWINGKEKLFNIIKKKADLAVIDSYLAPNELYKKISELVKTAVYIDDNNRMTYPNGIVVNGTTYAKELNFKKRACTTYFLGKKYALFRKEFWNIPVKKINKRLSTILLLLGGTDPRNLTPEVLEYLNKEHLKLTKNVIINKGFKKLSELKKIKKNSHENTVNLIFNPDARRIKQIMLSSDIAITTGGQTLYELARIGVPTIVISAAENQMNSIKSWEKSGLVFYAGNWKNKELMEKINEYVKKLYSYELRYRKSSKLKRIFDGKSTLRLIDELIAHHGRYKNEK